MAEPKVHFDEGGKTFLYIMYIEKLELQPESAEMAGSEVILRWYVDSEHDCSKNHVLAAGEIRSNYCSFLILTIPDLQNRAKQLTLSLSNPANDHLGVAFLDVANFSREEGFKTEKCELRNQAGVVAIADLHTACQQRWSYAGPIQIQTDGYFVLAADDAQAKMLHDHICQETGEDTAAAEQAASQQAAEERGREERRRKEEEEATRRAQEETRRKADEEKNKQNAEEAAAASAAATAASAAAAATAAAARRAEEEAAEARRVKEAEEARRREEEDTRRKKEAEGKHKKTDETDQLERDRRRKEEEGDHRKRREREEEEEREKDRERERRRRDEEDERERRERSESRRRQESEERQDRQRRLDDEDTERRRREDVDTRNSSTSRPSDVMDGRARERRQWEEDRERLKRDARREREREVAERERRADERRRAVEALTNARLASAEASAVETGPASRLATEHRARHTASTSSLGREHRSSRGGAGSRRTPTSAHRNGTPTRQGKPGPRESHNSQHGHHSRHAGQHAKVSGGQVKKLQHQTSWGRASHETGINSESEASEPNPFEDEWVIDAELAPADADADEDHAAHSQTGSFRWPRMGGTSSVVPSRSGSAGPAGRTKRPPTGGPVIGTRLGQGGAGTMHQASDVSLAARLENLRAHAQISSRLAANSGSEEVLVDSSDGLVPLLESSSMTPLEALRNRPLEGGLNSSFVGTQRSHQNTPRRKSAHTRRSQIDSETAARRAAAGNGVLVAAMTDATAGSISGALGSLPVSAVEESVLRLLVLQKELNMSSGEEPTRAVLADATAGLAPQMLQVLGAAKSVCEANRAKLQAYSEAQQLDIDRSEYLRTQMSALEKLQSQYATLAPCASANSGLIPPTHCPHCSSVFMADALFCRRCGQKREPAPPEALAAGDMVSPRSRLVPQNVRTMTPRGGHFAHAFGTPGSTFPNFQAGGSAASNSPPGTSRRPHYFTGEPSFSCQDAVRQPVDPGGPGPQLPMLRSGGSTPPRAKFRQQQHMHAQAPQVVSGCLSLGGCAGPGYPNPSPRSEQSSAWGMASARLQSPPRSGLGAVSHHTAAARVPAIPHWERRVDPSMTGLARGLDGISPRWDAVAAAVAGDHGVHPQPSTAASAAMWNAVAHNLGKSPRQELAQHHHTQPATVSSAAMWDSVSQNLGRSPRLELAQHHQPPPMHSAVQQLSGLVDELKNPASVRRGRGGGGAHAAAGSPSPERGLHQEHPGHKLAQNAQEDKYLKILQSLQAKGAVNGGLAAQLLEKQAGNRLRAVSARRAASRQVISSDSDSSEDIASLRWRSRRRAAAA